MSRAARHEDLPGEPGSPEDKRRSTSVTLNTQEWREVEETGHLGGGLLAIDEWGVPIREGVTGIQDCVNFGGAVGRRPQKEKPATRSTEDARCWSGPQIYLD